MEDRKDGDDDYKYIRVYPGTDITVDPHATGYTATFVIFEGNKYLKVPKWVRTKVVKQQKRLTPRPPAA